MGGCSVAFHLHTPSARSVCSIPRPDTVINTASLSSSLVSEPTRQPGAVHAVLSVREHCLISAV